MQRNQQPVSNNGTLVLWFLLVNALVLRQGFIDHPAWYKLVPVTLSLLILCLLFTREKTL